MPRFLYLCLGLLLVRVSRELNDISRARKLCGRHLLHEIVKLCGDVSWSHIEKEKPFTRLLSQASEKVESFIPDRSESSQTTFPVWRRATNPGKNLNQRHVCTFLILEFALPSIDLQEVEFLPNIHTHSGKLFFFLTSRKEMHTCKVYRFV